MYSPLLNLVAEYGVAVITAIISGFLVKAYFASKMHRKIRHYQSEIVKSHAKILELEATNFKLESKLKDSEQHFQHAKMVMN